MHICKECLYLKILLLLEIVKYEDFNSNIKFRLEIDYCINGFAFREGLEKTVIIQLYLEGLKLYMRYISY